MKYKHTGPEGRHKFCDIALGDGEVTLHHYTATYNGTRFAVEYICNERGQVKFALQAGMAVYELAGPDRLQAVRIYDDVSPPCEN